MSEQDREPDFRISYQPDSGAGFFGDPPAEAGDETALVFERAPCGKDGHMWTGTQFYILKGDFREDYAKIIRTGGGKWECKHFYDSQKKRFGSRHSTDFHEWAKEGTRRRKSRSTPRRQRSFSGRASAS